MVFPWQYWHLRLRTSVLPEQDLHQRGVPDFSRHLLCSIPPRLWTSVLRWQELHQCGGCGGILFPNIFMLGCLRYEHKRSLNKYWRLRLWNLVIPKQDLHQCGDSVIFPNNFMLGSSPQIDDVSCPWSCGPASQRQLSAYGHMVSPTPYEQRYSPGNTDIYACEPQYYLDKAYINAGPMISWHFHVRFPPIWT